MMKTHLMVFACVAIGLGVGCEDARKPGPAGLQVQPASEDLMELLPASALAAVEFLGLDDRWEELRSIPALAGLQDRLFGELGLEAEDVPAIAGKRAIVALLADQAARNVVPVAVLDPPSAGIARQRLAASEALFAVEARGALWAGPASQARRIEAIAAGDGTSFGQAIDAAALAQRLPDGGLVRVVVNPAAIGSWLRRWAEYHATSVLRPLARLIAADLDAIEVCGFRRDIADGELVTHLWVGIDADVVPAALVRALATDRGPAVLPPDLPHNTLVARSFRIDAAAGLAWLRAVAARDSDGPLRQLDFWIEEFEARSGRDVERDIVAALGERGLALVLESEGGGAEALAIIDARDANRLEGALVDLRDWLGEQIPARTFGLAHPRSRDGDPVRGAAHALDLWSPFGVYSGPVFQLVGEHLVVATNGNALSLARRLAASAEGWRTPAWAAIDDSPPDDIAVVRPGALAGILTSSPSYLARRGDWLGAVAAFLSMTGDGRLRADYQPDGFLVTGWLGLDAGRSAVR